MVDLGMAFVDNWAMGKEKGYCWLSNDIVGLVGNLAVKEWQTQHGLLPHSHPLHLPQFSHSSKQDD